MLLKTNYDEKFHLKYIKFLGMMDRCWLKKFMENKDKCVKLKLAMIIFYIE